VLEALGNTDTAMIGSYRKAYLKRLQRAGVGETDIASDFHVPEVTANNFFRYPYLAVSGTLVDSIAVYDSKYKLSKLNIFVNDIPLGGKNGIDLKSLQSSIVRYPISLPLSVGYNKIDISATNEKGAESRKETHYFAYSPKEKPASKTYFIGIGVDKYKDSAMNLKYAEKDIKDLSLLFSWKSEDVQVVTLLNERVTRDNVLALKKMLLQTSIHDKVIISLSGHGILSDNKEFYFATHDISFDNPAKNGILYEDLEGLLDNIPARQKLLMIDACHSGEVDGTETAMPATTIIADTIKLTANTRSSIKNVRPKVGLKNSLDLMKELFSDLSTGNGTVVISAAGGYEYALEDGKYSNGVFTYCIKKGLLENAAEKDGQAGISVSELREYVTKEVERLTSGRQKPTSRKEILYADWNVW
jgi:hypothetical protein